MATNSLNAPVVGLVRSGFESLRRGRVEEARALHEDAARQFPNASGTLHLGGLIALARGEFAKAAKILAKAVDTAPDHADVRFDHARALERSGRPREALTSYQASLTLAPDNAVAHARTARLHAEAGERRLSLAHSRIGLALDPASIEAALARGGALHAAARFDEADDVYRSALERTPDDQRLLTAYAAFLVKTQNPAKAVEPYRRAAEADPQNGQLLASLGIANELHGDIETALAIYERAIALAPNNPDIQFRRASCIRDLGRFDEAVGAFGDTLERHPSHAPSLAALARMKRLDDTPATRSRLTRVIADRSNAPEQGIQAGFALGDLFDRAGESDAAFKRYEEANHTLRRERLRRGERFDVADMLANARMVEQHLAGRYARETGGWGVDSDLPVFIVGLPRSGTTLVEQICASHSKVHGAGEMEDLLPMTRALASHNVGAPDLADWDKSHARGLAKSHLEYLREVGEGAARVVNKTPLNIMRLGPIGAFFPGARVIWCRRDLRDVVVSQHTMYFSEGNLFSTDLTDCAFAARQIERMGEAWRRESRLSILKVGYEDLVADLETHAHRIIDFLGLDWEPACLDFHNTRRHVDTPSSWQVRQPIYTSSVGRWRRFEKHLGPMLTTLAQPIDQLPTTK